MGGKFRLEGILQVFGPMSCSTPQLSSWGKNLYAGYSLTLCEPLFQLMAVVIYAPTFHHCEELGSIPSIIPHRYEAFPPKAVLPHETSPPAPTTLGFSAANLTLLNLSSLCPKQLCSRSELESAQHMQVNSSFSGAVLLFTQPRVSSASLAAWAHC